MSSTRCQFTTSQLIFLCCVYRVPNIVSNFLSNCHLSIASDEYTLFPFFCVSLMCLNFSRVLLVHRMAFGIGYMQFVWSDLTCWRLIRINEFRIVQKFTFKFKNIKILPPKKDFIVSLDALKTRHILRQFTKNLRLTNVLKFLSLACAPTKKSRKKKTTTRNSFPFYYPYVVLLLIHFPDVA
jgi:hypothetical protein